MDYHSLKSFLLNKLSMSHIYQPLVIKTLLENNGIAPIRLIAREFLAYDEAQVEYYIKIAKRWPKVTLYKHNIIDTDKKGFYRLKINITELSEEQKKDLIQICDEKIIQYIQSYKGIIGNYRYNPEDLASSSIRYQVLKEAHGRCALCGSVIYDTPIDVDHIVPRNRGGTNNINNLQALCYRCNRAKRDRDQTDFKNYGFDSSEPDCVFCSLNDRVNESYNTAQWVFDNSPVTPFHSLIIPRRHVQIIDDLNIAEFSDLFLLAKLVKRKLVEMDSTIRGFNVGFNEGIVAGQTIKHLHLHIIPRHEGDVQNPRGGIRQVLPNEPNY